MNASHPRTPAAILPPLAAPFVLLLALGVLRAAPLPEPPPGSSCTVLEELQGMLGSGGRSPAAV